MKNRVSEDQYRFKYLKALNSETLRELDDDDDQKKGMTAFIEERDKC